MTMNSGRFVLGSDIGTGSCKTALLDATGRIVAWVDDSPTAVSRQLEQLDISTKEALTTN